jgi:hypothetical protein
LNSNSDATMRTPNFAASSDSGDVGDKQTPSLSPPDRLVSGAGDANGSKKVGGDALCVTYNTWPLPRRLAPPPTAEMFIVWVQWVSDPSNFVVSAD